MGVPQPAVQKARASEALKAINRDMLAVSGRTTISIRLGLGGALVPPVASERWSSA
jgi:hypothetical protein